jgi:hypothetical protein
LPPDSGAADWFVKSATRQAASRLSSSVSVVVSLKIDNQYVVAGTSDSGGITVEYEKRSNPETLVPVSLRLTALPTLNVANGEARGRPPESA